MPEQMYSVTPVEWDVLSAPLAVVWASEPAVARTKVRRWYGMPAAQSFRVHTCIEEGPIVKLGCP